MLFNLYRYATVANKLPGNPWLGLAFDHISRIYRLVVALHAPCDRLYCAPVLMGESCLWVSHAYG